MVTETGSEKVKAMATGSEKDSDSGWEMATDLGSAKGSVMEMEKD